MSVVSSDCRNLDLKMIIILRQVIGQVLNIGLIIQSVIWPKFGATTHVESIEDVVVVTIADPDSSNPESINLGLID